MASITASEQCVPLKKAPNLPENIRQGSWKGLPGSNGPAY